MERCKTCRYWEKPENDYIDVLGTGKCNAVVQFWGATKWTADYDKRMLKPEYAGKLAFVQDGEQLREYVLRQLSLPQMMGHNYK